MLETAMNVRSAIAMASLLLAVTPCSVSAQDGAQAPLATVLNCRAIEDQSARLQCYDTAVAALDARQQAGDVVVVDRAELQANERQLFGFALPSLSLFSRENTEPVQRLAATLSSTSQQASGKWLFRLSDGSVWRQTDSQRVRSVPRTGAEVTVRRAAMGSFMLDPGPGRSIRVERVQ